MRVLQTLALPLGHVTLFGVMITTPFGAADEARTRYLHLGKVALYQMSYGRIRGAFILAPSRSYLKRGPRESLRMQDFVGKRRNFSACHGGLARKTARQAADISTWCLRSESNQ